MALADEEGKSILVDCLRKGQKFHNLSVTDGPPAKRIEKI